MLAFIFPAVSIEAQRRGAKLPLVPRHVPDAQVLSAAVEVVVRRGYAGATTKQIAEAADINEVTLFRRFGTKAGLLKRALLDELEHFGGAGGVEHTGDLEGDLERIVSAYAELLRRRGRLIPIVLAEVPHHPELAEVVAIPQRIIAAISALVARYQREGLLEPEPPIRTVAALLAPLLVPALLGEHSPDHAMRQPLDARAHVIAFLDGRRRPSRRARGSPPRIEPRERAKKK